MDVGDQLKELNMTPDEIDRFSKAFKDETFRGMLLDYAKELSDPKNKKKYEEEIKLLEQERGNNIEFIHPEPFKALKTSVDGKQKCFINICANEKVGKPEFKLGTSEDGRMGQHWSLPHTLHPGRQDRDPKGKKIMIYDVIFHPDTLHMASRNKRFMDMVDRTAVHGIQVSFKVTLDKNNLRELAVKYKGTPQPCVIRKTIPGYKPKEPLAHPDPLAFPYPDEKRPTAATTPAKIKDSGDAKPVAFHVQTQKPKEPTVPKYTLKYRSVIDLQDFRCSRDSAQSPRPKEIVVTVDMPLLKSAKDASLEIKGKSLVLESQKPAYRLEVPLAYPVDEDEGQAKFNKQKGQLTVTLPVLPSNERFEFAARPTQTDRQEEEEEKCQEHKREGEKREEEEESGVEKQQQLKDPKRGGEKREEEESRVEEQLKDHKREVEKREEEEEEESRVEKEESRQEQKRESQEIEEGEESGVEREGELKQQMREDEKNEGEEGRGVEEEQMRGGEKSEDEEKLKEQKREGMTREDEERNDQGGTERSPETDKERRDRAAQMEDFCAAGFPEDTAHQHMDIIIKDRNSAQVHDNVSSPKTENQPISTFDGDGVTRDEGLESLDSCFEKRAQMNNSEEHGEMVKTQEVGDSSNGNLNNKVETDSSFPNQTQTAAVSVFPAMLPDENRGRRIEEVRDLPAPEKAKDSSDGNSCSTSAHFSEELASGSVKDTEREEIDEDDLTTEQTFPTPDHNTHPPPAFLREIDEDRNEIIISDHSTSAGFIFQNSLLYELD